MENDVIEKPLSADEALDRLREAGRIEAASIAALGRMWSWKRERTSKALIRWEGAGHIQREEGPDGTVIIRVPGAVPADDPADDHAVPAGNPAGTAPDDGPLPASDDVPAPGPDDVPAGNPDLPVFDAVDPVVEGPAVITGIPGSDDDVSAGIPAGNAPMVEKPVGVPAVSPPVEWRIVERPVWHPIVLSLDVQPPAHPDAQRAHPAHPARRSLASITPSSATIAYLVAYGLFVVGLTVNVTLAISYVPQSSWWRAIIMAVEGLAIEVLAFRSPSWGCELWRGGSKVAAASAWGIWPVMFVMSLMAATGFSASTIGDVLAQRSAAVTKASAAAIKASNNADDIKKLREKRDAIAEKRSVQVIKLQIVRERFKVDRIDRDAFDASVGCTRLTADVTKACNAIAPTLQALAAAQDRDKLDQNIKDAEKPQEGAPEPLDGAPIIWSVDPGAESFSKIMGWISRGWITPSPDDVAVLRLLGLTIVPSLAGLVLMFAQLLAAPRTTPLRR